MSTINYASSNFTDYTEKSKKPNRSNYSHSPPTPTSAKASNITLSHPHSAPLALPWHVVNGYKLFEGKDDGEYFSVASQMSSSVSHIQLALRICVLSLWIQ